jgi:hypothetical protein
MPPPPLVQVACYQLVLDRAVGEYRLPDGWTVFAAGNREGDRAVASRMSSAPANRFVHLTFEPDLDDWSRWAMGPGRSSARGRGLSPLASRTAAPLRADRESFFVTPCMGVGLAHTRDRPPVDTEFALHEGTVGRGAAIEFSAEREGRALEV